jgi:ATP-binding cassette subfamily B protein
MSVGVRLESVIASATLLRDLQRPDGDYPRSGSLVDSLRESLRSSRIDPAEPTVADPVAVPDRLTIGIKLESVSFKYPDTDAWVLRDVDLTIPAGATVAIVGENGAGKTTLVKLLVGFYRPSRGRILLDGLDLHAMALDQWRNRIAAGFQDFVRYELAAHQTIGVGDLPRVGDLDAVREALDRAQASTILDQLPHGLQTRLGLSYPDGVELSGGQWQKLALGRALMREVPLMLVLDEPTSALDPEAEHALFEGYATQARRAAANAGAITVLVSHRFSTVRMADMIIVVRDGTVVEHGPHAALMAAGGLYAELFGIQAAAYR